MDKDQNLSIAKKFAKRVRDQFPDAEIFLFGSRARGDHMLESDFDFIIVSDHFENILFYKRMPLIYEIWDEHYDIEPLCYTKEEFQKKKKQLSIVNEALKEAIPV
jgi:predicted nucleotidyltransferase